MSAAQHDAWYIACRTHIAAAATLVTARTWWVHTRVFGGGGRRVLEITPASKRVSKLITMVIKIHKKGQHIHSYQKNSKKTQFWCITVIIKNQIPDSPPSTPNITLNYFELPSSTMTVLWIWFFNTQNQWVLQKSNTRPHTGLYFSSTTDIGNTDGYVLF